MITLSVIVAVYNHEKYIEQAINSILKQKVTFNMEVLIGEDCSTDDSRKILNKIEKNCPEYFKFFYRQRNYGPSENFKDLYHRMQGKYFIVLEGDDYWTYEYKLQKQVEFLENNKEYISCAHNVTVVDENSNKTGDLYPECKEEEYTLNHFRKRLLPGQTATVMYRNFYKDKIIDISLEEIPFSAGDRRKAFMTVSQSKVYCIQENWSCYRYVTSTGSSFSATHVSNKKELYQSVEFYKEMINFSKRILNDQAICIAEELYFLMLCSSIKRFKKIKNFKFLIHEFVKCRYKKSVILYLINWEKLR